MVHSLNILQRKYTGNISGQGLPFLRCLFGLICFFIHVWPWLFIMFSQLLFLEIADFWLVSLMLVFSFWTVETKYFGQVISNYLPLTVP